MSLALHPIDYGVFALFLGSILAIGCYFQSQQRTTRDFFLAGKSFSWLSTGFAVPATLICGWSYLEIPGWSYESGLRVLVIPAMFWITAPLIICYVLPLFRGLNLTSVYEYAELRFDSRLRFAASMVILLIRAIWLTAVLCIPFKLLSSVLDVGIPGWALIIITGVVTTAVCVLGGMKASIWCDVLRTCLLLVSLAILVLTVWWSLDGGADRVWQVTTALGRDAVVESEFRWSSVWSVAGSAPHYFLLMMALFMVDPPTIQRYLTTRTARAAQAAFVLNGVTFTLALVGLAYVGLCLLAFYHDHSRELRAQWVANVNGETRQSLTHADRDRFLGKSSPSSTAERPLLDWNDPRDAITSESIDGLVQDRRILHPNRKTPWEDAAELLDATHPRRIDVDKLATRRPPKTGLRRGEVVLHVRAANELLPWFIAKQLPFGIAGLVITGIVAGTISALQSGVNAVSLLLTAEIFQRSRWWHKSITARTENVEDAINAQAQLRWVRGTTLSIGVIITLIALGIYRTDLDPMVLRSVVNFVAPVLGVFLLGIFSRQCTSAGALIGLTTGTVITLGFTLAATNKAFDWLWPFETTLSGIWPLTFGTVATLASGYFSSFLFGSRRSAKELRGLVVGCGELGSSVVRRCDSALSRP